MKTFLSIEVNEQKVRYLIVEQGIKGMAVKGAGVSALQVGPSAPGALSSFVKELVASRRLKVNRLFLTVNRRDTLVHQLNLGQVTKADLVQIIPAEIEKIQTFADSEFDYVYQQQEVKTRNKVIFGAMTDELLQYLLKEVRQTHIPCHEMEMAPLNLSGLLSAQEYKDGPQCFIVLNEQITHLVIFEGQQIRYLYSTTMGEEILGNLTATGNWGEELKRVLKSYTLDTKQTVSKAWLVWDKEKAPDFDNYLNQTLNFSVKPLAFLQEYFKEDINPAYSLAAVPLIYHVKNIKPSFSLNHFFRSTQVSTHIGRLVVVAAFIIIFTGIVLGGIVNRFYGLKHQAIDETSDVQRQMVAVQKQSTDILNERRAYLAMREQILFQATYVKTLKNLSWSQALGVVATELPKELALQSFKVDERGQVTLAGEAFRMESIAKLLRIIETSRILNQGQFSYLTEAEINKKKIFRFGILANIKTGEKS